MNKHNNGSVVCFKVPQNSSKSDSGMEIQYVRFLKDSLLQLHLLNKNVLTFLPP